MSIVRWQPFNEIDTLQREFNQLFDQFITPTVRDNSRGLAFVPPAELSETEDGYELRLEVPGMDAKDIEIEVTAEAISIGGDRKSETKTEENGKTRTEFRYGQFRRVIPLPGRIKNSEVKAEYKDGILNVMLPKAEEEKNKVVKVEIG
ncbi:Hsp20/alpha crystallin family protein [Lyngbya sp. CCY1209]|uniref:Hsp20/alpha crystallin family protein n=1 Tax=Lyngbya sp. CCY1209 TaxID=2886103 RepID=UPI002D205A4B|nr:Hsp20/alpha crystallin family protein [Lyngbya sp. CCY1209]MEB3882426.1 Hsp20/alpha crystallin family protein [Lyngbya sp. CCY1209]